MEYFEFRAMNTDILLAAEGSKAKVALGFEQTRQVIAAREAQFSRFLDDSETSRLNLSSGTWFRASPEMFAVVRQAKEFYKETKGLYDPSILDALERAGYDKSMDEMRAHGVTPRIHARALKRGEFGRVEFDDPARAIRLPSGVRIDLGGIAKGWIAEEAAQVLADFSHACVVNAGGDLFAVGRPTDEPMWRVALEDPRDPSATLAILRVGPGALATSSVTRRRWMQGEQERHHLIDPRTQAPAVTDWLSVTVVAPHATVAEVYAKVLLVAGSRGADQLAKPKDIIYIAVDNAGQMWGSESSKSLLESK